MVKMAANRTHMQVGRVPEGVQHLSDSDAEKFVEFVSLQSNASRSFRDETDMGFRMSRSFEQISARCPYEVWLDASSGRAESCLELGLRMYTGCHASQDKDGALDWWRRISDPTNPNFVGSVSRPVKAKALSCLANAYFEKSFLPNDTLQVDDLYRAGQLANASASLGLVSPIVLTIASRIEQIGFRPQGDCHFKGVNITRFGTLDFLWKAADARNEELNRANDKRGTKISHAPQLYVCAADGCGIESTSRSGLLQCSGKCPRDVKPSYCSKECQKADWKHHRITCKGDVKADIKSTTPPPKKFDDTISGHLRDDGRELNIDVPAPDLPGGTIRLCSTTMSSSWMKELRDSLSERGGDGVHIP